MFYFLSCLKDQTTTSNAVNVVQNFVKREHHAQSVDDALIGGLSYKLKPGAPYATNRRSVSYFASGALTVPK